VIPVARRLAPVPLAPGADLVIPVARRLAPVPLPPGADLMILTARARAGAAPARVRTS